VLYRFVLLKFILAQSDLELAQSEQKREIELEKLSMTQIPAPRISGVPPHQLDWMKRVKAEFSSKGHTPRDFHFAPPSTSSFAPSRSALDYCLKPFELWAPCMMWPNLVPFVPCPVANCDNKTTSRGWTKALRYLEGLADVTLLWATSHECPVHKTFTASNPASVCKLPLSAQMECDFVLTERAGASTE